MTLIGFILAEMQEDDEDQSEQLRGLYEAGTAEQQKVMDDMMTCLCGWSMKTLLTRVVAHEEEID